MSLAALAPYAPPLRYYPRRASLTREEAANLAPGVYRIGRRRALALLEACLGSRRPVRPGREVCAVAPGQFGPAHVWIQNNGGRYAVRVTRP